MKVQVTGAAGFSGSTLVLRLLERGDTVIGIDSHNDYYDPAIKEARLERFASHPKYTHLRIDLADRKAIYDCFRKYKPPEGGQSGSTRWRTLLHRKPTRLH